MHTTRLSALPKGTSFTRAACALILAKGRVFQAQTIAEQYRNSPATLECLKSAVAAGTTSDSNWASSIAQADFAASEFAEILRDGSIAGKLTGVRKVPLNIRYPNETASSSVAWVGEGAPTPVSKMQFSTNTLGIAKCAGIVVITRELALIGNLAAEGLVRNDLTKGSIEFLDQQFVDPGVAAVANVSPASITNSLPAAQIVQSTGSTATQIAADLASLVVLLADQNETDGLYWILTRSDCARLAAKRDTAGGAAFADIKANGTGFLLGIPVIGSNAVPHSTSAGTIVVLVNAGGIDYGDLTTLALDVSTEASLQMDDAPGAGAQSHTSLFQTNAAAVRLTAFRNWRRVRETSVAYLDNCHW